VDPAVLSPNAAPSPLRTSRRYKFLFVGGTIHRKGIDLLLEAYGRAFTADDDVCVVVKDMGVGSFYRGQTAEALIAGLRERRGAPEVEYLNGALSASEMAGLYTACDCLVQPYRGEGFGLPIVEAMACGLPVIVTGMGAALDYCDDTSAFLLPARVCCFPERRVGEWETVDRPWLAEPDLDALVAALRRVVTRPDEAKAKGAAGRARVLSGLTWDHSAEVVMRRLEELRRRPIRRLRRATGPATAAVAAAAPAPPATAQAPSAARMRVSLCIIVKNEEANLPACLGSAADLLDEIVVVDTGSTDRTKEVALRSGAKVYDFPWCDDFAAARNETLSHATGDWVFWLDADDRLDEENRARLRALFASLKDENVAYAMKCLCLPDKTTGTATVVDHVRLFRNRPDVRWSYRVHEQILPSVRKAGGQVRWSDATVHHCGYQDPALRARKLERDLRLLNLEDGDRPEDPFTLFNLGSVYHELARPAEALPRLRRSLEKSHPKDSIVRKLYALIVGCHRLQNQMEEALAACQEGRNVCPDDPELLFLEGLLRRERGDLAGAEACLIQVLDSKPGPHFASVDAGLSGYKARHNLAVVFHQQGRSKDAEAQWRLVAAERPDFLPGWLGLGETALRQGDWPLLEEAARRLDSLHAGPVEAAVLRGRGLLARREFTAARAALEAACARFPQELAARVVLTHVLLQEGKDLDAAEQALRDLLALAPEHAEARHNLDLLLLQRREQRERAADAVFAADGFAGPHGGAAAAGSGDDGADQPLILSAKGEERGPAAPAVRFAVVTIAHDEEEIIDAFLDHYLGHGADAVFLVDNDCTDSTVERARRRTNVVVDQLQSGELDEELRTATFQRLREACAGSFDWVLLVDCDEFLVPTNGGRLKAELAKHPDASVLGSEGWDVVQRSGELPIDWAAPLLAQRAFGAANPVYNKPVVLRPSGPERLAPGQHYLRGPEPHPAVRPFRLLHLAACDERCSSSEEER
jgi:glycosyltransferase involved in cell wall biosynthesis/Flp pilus assembly protein TadD